MNIMTLTTKELALIIPFAKLAEEAIKAEEIIKKYYSKQLGIGNKEIHVFATESCGEYYGDGYLSIDGIFRYHDNWWGGRDWKVPCNADGIFEVLKIKYLADNGMEEMIPANERDLEGVAHYFRMFIKETAEKL